MLDVNITDFFAEHVNQILSCWKQCSENTKMCWDQIQMYSLIWNFGNTVDFVDCFLPWNANVEAGPNVRRFLREPSEHIDVCHLHTKEVSSTAANKWESQTKLIGPSS